MLCISPFQPAESCVFVAKGDENRGNQRCGDVSVFSYLQKLSKNVPRVGLAAYACVGDSKTATRQTRCLLGFAVERDRFSEIPFLAMRRSQHRIQIKVIW